MQNSYWIKNIDDYVKVRNDNRQYLLLPEIANIIKMYDGGNKVLDHGCGEGYLGTNLSDNYEIGLYDINPVMIDLAKENLKNKSKIEVFDCNEEIYSNYYDFVVSSLVLMTIKDSKEFIKILQTLKRAKAEKGKIIIAVTHPCFRQYHYSTFQTEYSRGRSFDYFKESEPFKVFLDSVENKYVEIVDYHYSLSFLVNSIIENKIKIIKMFELQDRSIDQKFYNANFSPFLLIIGE
jgi:SAM-dependent methyltransferase